MSVFPAILNAFCISVKERLEFIICTGLIEIRPLLVRMDSQPGIDLLDGWTPSIWGKIQAVVLPFLVISKLFESAKRPYGVQQSGITCKNVGRNIDTVDFSSFILPILIHKGILIEHRLHIFLTVPPLSLLAKGTNKAQYGVTNHTLSLLRTPRMAIEACHHDTRVHDTCRLPLLKVRYISNEAIARCDESWSHA